MLSALEDVQLEGPAVLDHFPGEHHRVNSGNKFVVPVVPDEQGRHVGAGVVDEVQLRGAVLGDFRRIGVVELLVLLNGVGVVPGGVKSKNTKCVCKNRYVGKSRRKKAKIP